MCAEEEGPRAVGERQAGAVETVVGPETRVIRLRGCETPLEAWEGRAN